MKARDSMKNKFGHVNGYTFGALGCFDKEFIERCKHMASVLRPHFNQEFTKRFQEDCYAGERYNDNESVTLRAVSGILKYHDVPHGKYAGKEIQNTEAKDLKEWIWASLQVCAETDYYYTYEKVW
jgi:hypothetical protein